MSASTRAVVVAQQVARYAVWTVLIAVLIWGGLVARAWAFEVTAPIRFHGDVGNAVNIGRFIVMDAARQNVGAAVAQAVAGRPQQSVKPSWSQVAASYLDVYDDEYAWAQSKGLTADSAYHLDYPPGRLLIVTAWCKYTADQRGLAFGYSDEMVRPMLAVNTVHELLAAAGAAALVWQALRRSGATSLRAESLSLFVGALVWFNPAMILDAHGWPQWDAWVLPYTLWASFFALRDRWLMAGALLAAGAMFKGQVLLMTPLFLLWPLYRLRIDAAMRLLIGFGVTFAVLLSPWLIYKAESFAVLWAGVAMVLAMAIAFWPRSHRLGAAWWMLAVAMTGWLALAAMGVGAVALPVAVIATAILCALASIWRGRRWPLSLGATAVVLFAAGSAFHGSFAWLHVGFQTDRYPVLHAGNTVNLPAILERFYAYGSDAPVTIDSYTISLRILLRYAAYLGVAVAALGVSLRERSRDANVLVGFVAAWAVLYALMPQMHERYLVWAAATSAILAARSFGGLLLHLSLTALQCAMLFASLIPDNLANHPYYGPIDFIARGMSPAAGWSTITLAGVLLVWSFAKSRSRDATPSLVVEDRSDARRPATALRRGYGHL